MSTSLLINLDYTQIKSVALLKDVIRQLPENDAEFPWINKSMFSIPNDQGVFRDQIITFGASYKTLECEWHKWIEKFESILRQLFWFDVTIHAEFEVMGTYQYNWLTNPDLIGQYWHKEVPEPITDWKFDSDGPRTFTDRLKIGSVAKSSF